MLRTAVNQKLTGLLPAYNFFVPYWFGSLLGNAVRDRPQPVTLTEIGLSRHLMNPDTHIRQEAQVESCIDVLICPSLVPGCLYWYILGTDGMPFIYGDVDCSMETIRNDAYIDIVKAAIVEELGVQVGEIRTIDDSLQNISLSNKRLIS